jgi:hypothetical protein
MTSFFIFMNLNLKLLKKYPLTFRLTATLRVLEPSSLGKIENVLKIKRLAS